MYNFKNIFKILDKVLPNNEMTSLSIDQIPILLTCLRNCREQSRIMNIPLNKDILMLEKELLNIGPIMKNNCIEIIYK